MITTYRSRFLKAWLCLLVASFYCAKTMAVEEPYLNELKGAQVAEGGFFTVADEKFTSPTAWSLIQQNISVNDIVSFEINFDTAIYFYDKPFECTVKFKIYIYGEQGDTSKITDSVTHSNISLQVRFDTTTGKAYKGIALYKFANAHKYKIKILSITSPQLNPIPAIFRLKGQIIVDRQYIFQDNSTDVTRYAVVNGNQLQLNWSPFNYPGAEVFDLEYTHVDGASLRAGSIRNYQNGNQYFVPADSLNKWFVNNNTRITTPGAGYLLNIPYDSGFILFRIRGAQIHYPDGIRWEGNWNYQATEVSGTCSTCPSGVVFFNPHEASLNWQYSATFAEEGKRKEVISYFDGTLRNRQSVTIANSENKTIVQETIYDALGRPVLNMLPAPANDSTLHLFRGFNNNQSGNPYSFADLLYANCTTTAAAVSAVSGAGNYYSSSNVFLDKYYYAKYIPSAEGYPFSVTEYMADNTGRVKAQGGLGPIFQLNQGHETKYFYGKPTQTELDRLFGTEAGNASHYLKNMVVDPNGQISVSYVNASGKTIATALAGNVPGNVHALPSGATASTQVSNELIQPEDFLRNAEDYSISTTTTFLAPVTGTYVFKYRVDPLRMEKKFGANSEKVICNNCYYDLEITIKDDCNNIIKQETKAAGNIFDTACATPPGPIAGTINTSIPAIGEYYVTYRLVISKEALNYYDSTHLVKNTDLKKVNDFLREELKNTDFSGCFNNCETCFDALGAKEAFTQRFKNFYTADSVYFGPEDSLWVLSLYDSLYDHCRSIQGQCGANVCDEKLQLLKMDVRPGGQYAMYDTTSYALLEPAVNVLAQRHQVVLFTDAYGNRDSVTLYNADGEDSVRVDVKDLDDAQFITHWKDEWADSLVRLHPEYCHYLWCIANSESFAFDKEMEDWRDADSVMAKGWFYPDQYDAILAHDPFFLAGAAGYALRGKMQDSLRLFSRTFARTSLSDKNILRFIDVVLYCKSQYNGWESCNPDSSCRSRNREWLLYSQLYLNLKRYFYEEARRTSGNPVFANCVNCYIGKDIVGSSGVTPPTSSYVAFTDPTCNYSCPAGIYNPYDKDNISLYIQYGTPGIAPSAVPAGYGNCRFYSAYDLQTAANNSCKFFNVWVCTYDSSCVPVCAPPTNLTIVSRDHSSFLIAWTPSVSQVTNYRWRIFKLPDLTSPVQTGTTNGTYFTISGLSPSSNYKIEMSADCDGDLFSAWAAIECATAAPHASITVNCSDVNCTEQGNTILSFNFGQPTLAPMTLYFGEITRGQNGLRFAAGYDLFTIPSGVSPSGYYAGDGVGSNVPFQVTIPAGVTTYTTSGNIWQVGEGPGNFDSWICHRCIFPITDLYVRVHQPAGLLWNFTIANSNITLHNLSAAPGDGDINCPQTVFPGYQCASDTSGNHSSACPDDPRAALYKDKIRRYSEYVNVNSFIDGVLQGNPQQNNTEQQQVLLAECRSTCEAQADIWMNQLKGCTTDATKLVQLKQALIDICSRGCSIERPFGASSIPVDSPAVYHSFEEAMIGILGTGSINASCTVALLANPYPYDKQPVYTERLITETNYEICEKIFEYKNAWNTSGSGISFHSYLLRTLKNGYQLDSLELDDLLNSCTNCNGLLKDDVVLPPAFEPNAIPCLVCEVVQTAQTAFNAKFPGLSNTHDNYEILFSNFFNHRFGYALTYDQYRNYLDSCNAHPSYAVNLCNQAVTPEGEIENNGNGCMADLFATALTNAGNRYIAYIDSVRRDFRDAYMTRCMNVQPALTMTAELYEYHYTLYYYDQSGSLVKTIPPEGVTLLNSAQLELVKLHRLLQKEGCYQYSDSIRFNNNGQIAWNLAHGMEAGPWTAEMMTHLNAYADQVLISKLSEYTYDTSGGVSLFYRHAGFVIKLENNKLAVELYGIDADTVQRKAAGTSILPASVLLPLGKWTHFVVSRTGIPSEPIRLWINGNQAALQVIQNRYDSSVTLSGNAPLMVAAHGAQHIAMPGKLRGTIKNLRLYDRVLGASEIRQIAYNNCQLPVSRQGLVFWSAMNDATNNLVKEVITRQSGQLTGFTWQPFAGVFPKHRLPTFYQYNSLGQVVLQFTPDGDTSLFWYDRLGRLTASQNREQKDNPSYSGSANRFSYTLYDRLGRITEAGEKSQPSSDIRNINLLDTTAVKNWLASGINKQVTKTLYDQPVNLSLQSFTTSRKRVVASIYLEDPVYPEGDSTLYSYDINGNVKTLIQHVNALVNIDPANGKKRIDYDYDLASGKVNTVSYQQGKGDQFFYKYQYDADNRVIRAYTSRDKLIWNEEASYVYYLHGPLARTELGQLKVQGVDYAYTLQGWMKGINGDGLVPEREIGQDGYLATPFSRVSRDVFSMQLGYYDQDYTPIGGTNANAFRSNVYQSPGSLEATGNQLFNGNISYTTLALSKINNGATTGYTYGYDQLNRLTEMRQHNATGAWNNGQIINAYRESIAYDANGNILKYLRRGANAPGLPLDMDSLTYRYNRDAEGRLVNNQLNHVRDAIGAGNYSVDIDDQAAGNYQYDKIGNLVGDAAEGIDNIRWTAYGKINQINKNNNTVINFGYDPNGNRILKLVASSQANSKTFYVRDAQGNVLAVYSSQGIGGSLHWAEQHLYGTSRLGMWNWDTTIPVTPPLVENNPLYDSLLFGSRAYELYNHLDNVLTTINDKKIGIKLSSSTGVEFYVAEPLSQLDYYPFGMLMPGRQHNSGKSYRYGFNGKENDDELKGEGNQQDYGKRVYDPRLGKFLSVDPIFKQYPELTPYQFASNRPIDGIDIDGLEYYSVKIKIVDGKAYQKVITEDYTKLDENVLTDMHKDILQGYYQHNSKTGKLDKYLFETFYERYSKGFGKKGPGINYEYEIVNTKKGTTTKREIFFPWDGITKHGVFAGAGCPTKCGPITRHEKGRNDYDYDFTPVDEVDYLSQQHDIGYDFEGYSGHMDTKTLEADYAFVKGLQEYLKRAKDKNYKDKFTGRRPSKDAIQFAKNAIKLFSWYFIPEKEEAKKMKESPFTRDYIKYPNH